MRVEFEILGYEKFDENGFIPEFGREVITDEEAEKYNIGDIRVGCYDFLREGCELAGVLQYAYLHSPNDFEHSRGYVPPGKETGFLGNIMIGRNNCFRSSDLPDMNYYSGSGQNKCGWRATSFTYVFAHELGHALSLHHEGDCGSGKRPCLEGEPDSIMLPSASFSVDPPNACTGWVKHWIREAYCGSQDCNCKRQTARYDSRGRLDPALVKRREARREARARRLGKKVGAPMAWMITSDGECRLSKAIKQ